MGSHNLLCVLWRRSRCQKGSTGYKIQLVKKGNICFIMVCVISDVLKGNKDFIPALGLWMTLPSRST